MIAVSYTLCTQCWLRILARQTGQAAQGLRYRDSAGLLSRGTASRMHVRKESQHFLRGNPCKWGRQVHQAAFQRIECFPSGKLILYYLLSTTKAALHCFCMFLIVLHSQPFPHSLQTVIPSSLEVLGELWEDQERVLVWLQGVLAREEAVETEQVREYALREWRASQWSPRRRREGLSEGGEASGSMQIVKQRLLSLKGSYVNVVQLRIQLFEKMEKQHKLKKLITPKKMDDFLLQQEHLKQDKHFSPGVVEFKNTHGCTARVVNFFGDIHTEVFSLRINSNEKEVAVGCSNGEVKVYDIYKGEVLTIGNTSRMSGFPCTSVRWKPMSSSDFVACNCDGTIKWYNRGQETAYGHYERNEVSFLCSDYQAKEEWCLFGTDLNTIEIFDNLTMKQTHVYEAGGPSELNFNHHTNRVFCVKCMPNDSNVFFSGGWDSTVQVWDIRVGTGSVRKICGPSVSADSLDIRKGVLLAGNYQNNDIVQLYDFGKGELIQTLDIGEPHNSNSYCFTASFAHRSEHELIAIGLTGSNKVKILNKGAMVCEMKFQAAPLSLDFYRFNNKDFLMVGGIEGTIYAIRIDVAK